MKNAKIQFFEEKNFLDLKNSLARMKLKKFRHLIINLAKNNQQKMWPSQEKRILIFLEKLPPFFNFQYFVNLLSDF